MKRILAQNPDNETAEDEYQTECDSSRKYLPRRFFESRGQGQ